MTPDEVRQNNTENGIVETPEECDHRVVAWFTVSFVEWLIEQGYFVYCPKCGEKL